MDALKTVLTGVISGLIVSILSSEDTKKHRATFLGLAVFLFILLCFFR
ncbi:MAG: hypothetical protein LBV67_01195 [Streptococcaceae bacterium]|nr:hypothetical protein [Streptococcaceae bacterium]